MCHYGPLGDKNSFSKVDSLERQPGWPMQIGACASACLPGDHLGVGTEWREQIACSRSQGCALVFVPPSECVGGEDEEFVLLALTF